MGRQEGETPLCPIRRAWRQSVRGLAARMCETPVRDRFQRHRGIDMLGSSPHCAGSSVAAGVCRGDVEGYSATPAHVRAWVTLGHISSDSALTRKRRSNQACRQAFEMCADANWAVVNMPVGYEPLRRFVDENARPFALGAIGAELVPASTCSRLDEYSCARCGGASVRILRAPPLGETPGE